MAFRTGDRGGWVSALSMRNSRSSSFVAGRRENSHMIYCFQSDQSVSKKWLILQEQDTAAPQFLQRRKDQRVQASHRNDLSKIVYVVNAIKQFVHHLLYLMMMLEQAAEDAIFKLQIPC